MGAGPLGAVEKHCLARLRGVVAGMTRRHRDRARSDDHRTSVRLGAPETRRPFPVADRQDHCAEARSGSSRARHPRAADLNTVCLYRYQPSGFDWSTSTHSACTSAASRAGSIRSAAFGAPAAGSTTSNVLNVTSTNTRMARRNPKRQTPPTGWPVLGGRPPPAASPPCRRTGPFTSGCRSLHRRRPRGGSPRPSASGTASWRSA